MKRERAKTKGFTVRFTDDLHRAGEMYAVQYDLDFSELVRVALSDYLARNPHGPNVPAAPQKPKPRRKS